MNTDAARALLEKAIEKVIWRIDKWHSDADRLSGRKPFESKILDGNLLLNDGINELWTLVAGGGGTAFNNANSYLGVGDSSTAESATQTGLQAATNKLYKAMDTGYPTYGTSQKITFRSTFGGSDANFAWNEFTAANGNSDAAKNLNRKTSSQGTKTSGQSWQLTLEITLS
jgi:hypothetical protein